MQHLGNSAATLEEAVKRAAMDAIADDAQIIMDLGVFERFAGEIDV